MLMSAIDLLDIEYQIIEEKKRAIDLLNSKKSKKNITVNNTNKTNTNNKNDENNTANNYISKNPIFLGLPPLKYLIKVISRIKAPELEQSLFLLPFYYMTRLLTYLIKVCI